MQGGLLPSSQSLAPGVENVCGFSMAIAQALCVGTPEHLHLQWVYSPSGSTQIHKLSIL